MATESSGGNDRNKRRVYTAVSWVVTALLVALVVGVGMYGASRKAPPPEAPPKKLVNVEVARVAARVHREALVLPALVEADRSGVVAPEFQGRLARWLVAEGALVAEGQVVAELDQAALEATRGELTARRGSAERGVERARAGVAAAGVAVANARAQVAAAELGVRAAGSDRELARTEFERATKLVELRVLDRATLDTATNARAQAEIRADQAAEALGRARLGVEAAEAAAAEARAALAAAEAGVGELGAALASVQVQLAKALLRAPLAGRLEEHLAEPGEVVASGAPVARVYDLARLRAVVQVPDRYVGFLDPANRAASAFVAKARPGATREVAARVEVPGLPRLTGGDVPGLEVPARVARIAQAADPTSNTFAVELRFDNPGGALRQGLIARARLEYLTYPQAIVIPVAAVQVTDEGPRVLVVERVGDAELARARAVEPGSVAGDELLLLGGLAPGERLVVAGWKGVVPGEAVSVVAEDGVFRAAAAPAR